MFYRFGYSAWHMEVSIRQSILLSEFFFPVGSEIYCIYNIEHSVFSNWSFWKKILHEWRNIKFYQLSFSRYAFCQIIWQIFTQRRAKKNRQKLPPVGIETRTTGSWGQCFTNWARQEVCWAGDFWSELCLFRAALHMLDLNISRINRVWLYKGQEDSGWQLNVDLAQLMIQRSWFQSPLGAIFDEFFCSFLCKDLSDNLTETPIVKNSSDSGNLTLPTCLSITIKSLTNIKDVRLFPNTLILLLVTCSTQSLIVSRTSPHFVLKSTFSRVVSKLSLRFVKKSCN